MLLQAYARKTAGLELKDQADVQFGAPPLLNELVQRDRLDAVLNFWNFNAQLKAKGFVSPYLKSFVVARSNPLRFMKEPPELEVDGEMHGDSALEEDIRRELFPRSKLQGPANLLVCPSLDAANIAFNLLKAAADGLHVGPILLGPRLPAHILTPSVTARGIVNMSALAVVDAQEAARLGHDLALTLRSARRAHLEGWAIRSVCVAHASRRPLRGLLRMRSRVLPRA